MDILTVVLRLVHITSSALWVGGATLFFFYVEPAIGALGADGQKVLDELMNRRKVPVYFAIAATLAVLAGAVLYLQDSKGLHVDWITSPTGLVYTVGGLAAFAAWLGGNLLIPRTIVELGAIGAELRATAGPPGAELIARLRQTQERLKLIGAVDLVLLAISIVGMAVARELT